MKRDETISICKGMGIIMMVLAHGGCPSALAIFSSEMMMPMFFFTSGYFFSTRYLHDEATFVKKRLKGLYLPFVKWSVVFLVLHNLMFHIGLLSEQVGNNAGGVTHPYSWHVMEQRLWNIVTAMASYDEFLCGAYWFFRALLVASIGYLILFKGVDSAFRKVKKRDASPLAAGITVCVITLLLAAWQTGEGLRVLTLVQGGYRDLMGIFFLGCGFVFRQLRERYRVGLCNTAALAAVTAGFALFAHAGMDYNASFESFIKLPIPAVCGTLMMYNISWWIDRKGLYGKRFLVYCGNNTLYILLFHFVAFKAASLLKIWYYGLDHNQLAAFPVIQYQARSDGFWLVYALAGVGLPLLWIYLYRKVSGSVCLPFFHRP